ncbi:MAG: single-stranded DNA-binding protein, partial [Gemmatimonadota bacterium]
TWTDRDGQKKERTDWHSIAYWKQNNAEALSRFMRKGMPVCVVGAVRPRQWEDESGGKHSSYEVEAEQVCLTERRPGDRS